MNGYKLSSPWNIYEHKLEALFEQDPDITIDYDEMKKEVKFYVEDNQKANALMQILPSEKTFSNVTLKITIIPANIDSKRFDLYELAFRNNPIVSYTDSVPAPTGGAFNFMVFEKAVIQFFNDDITDINGVESTLYQNVAKEIFEDDVKTGSIFFCTDTDE